MYKMVNYQMTKFGQVDLQLNEKPYLYIPLFRFLLGCIFLWNGEGENTKALI